MKVKECMCSNAITAKPDTTVSDVAKLMSQNHIGFVPICNEQNNIVGLVTDRDIILRSIACDKDIKTTPISDIMTTNIYDVTENTELTDATKLMCDCQVKRLPVVDSKQVVGIITLGDLANHQNVNSQEVSNTVEGICKCGCGCKNDS